MNLSAKMAASGRRRLSRSLALLPATLLWTALPGCDTDNEPDLAARAIEEVARPVATPPTGAAAPDPSAASQPRPESHQVTLSAEQMADLRRSLREVELEAAGRAEATAQAHQAEEDDHDHGGGCGCAAAREAAETRPLTPRQDIMGPWRVMELAGSRAGETVIPPPGAIAHFGPDSYTIAVPGREPLTVDYRVDSVAGQRMVGSMSSAAGQVTMTFMGRSHVRVTDQSGQVLLVLAR